MERMIRVKNISLNVYEQGKGTPLLILHGWGSSSHRWVDFVDRLPRDMFRVIIPDLPGFGKSPEPPADWGLQNYTQLVHELIQQMKIEQGVILGHSFGGRVAIQLAKEHPSAMRLLVLCGAAGIVRHRAPVAPAFFVASKVGKAVFAIPGLNRLEDKARRGLYFMVGRRDYYYASKVMRGVMSKSLQENLRPLLTDIQSPTLLLWGDKDRATPLSDGKIAASMIPNNKLVVLKGCGHAPQQQAPDKVAASFLDFFKEYST